MSYHTRIWDRTYKDVVLDSESHGRWAVFFETLGLKWEYQTRCDAKCAREFIPTFKVHYPGGEVYPARIEFFYVHYNSGYVLDRRFLQFVKYQNDLTLIDTGPNPLPFAKLCRDNLNADSVWDFFSAQRAQGPRMRSPGSALWTQYGVPMLVKGGALSLEEDFINTPMAEMKATLLLRRACAAGAKTAFGYTRDYTNYYTPRELQDIVDADRQ